MKFNMTKPNEKVQNKFNLFSFLKKLYSEWMDMYRCDQTEHYKEIYLKNKKDNGKEKDMEALHSCSRLP